MPAVHERRARRPRQRYNAPRYIASPIYRVTYALRQDIEGFAGVTLRAGTLYGALSRLEAMA
jgi:hypothetical protein